LTEEILYDAIQRILTDPRYALRMKEVSALSRDEMTSALDRAVYWIEYVIRHQGALHLRSASRQLSLYTNGGFIVVSIAFLVAYVPHVPPGIIAAPGLGSKKTTRHATHDGIGQKS
jgi:glucuronosyltransferase